MSAGSSLPSSNLSPVGVKASICGPLFSLILPSMIICDAPTSARGFSTGGVRTGSARTEVVAAEAQHGEDEEAGAVDTHVGLEADLVQAVEELPRAEAGQRDTQAEREPTHLSAAAMSFVMRLCTILR